MRYGIVFTLLLLLQNALSGQKITRFNDPDKPDYQYSKEFSGGARIQTNGISVCGEFGWIKDINRTRLIQVEYTYFLNYKLKRTRATPFGRDSGKDYFYGLQNRFHALRFSYGFKRSIADKAKYRGVRLSLIGYGGFSLGLLKPYYLNLRYIDDNQGLPVIRPERYSAANRDVFLTRIRIDEAAPIRFGLSEMEPVPGIHTRWGLNFDWGVRDEFMKALECGLTADIYYKRLPILVDPAQNRAWQLGLYLSFHFGKRW
jgi:hypothetical protein